MGDASTNQPVADVQESAGQGRHRGPVSVHDSEAAPHGRHRKQVEETGHAA